MCALLSKRACRDVPNQYEKVAILRSLAIERVQSGFVAGVDVPSAQIYENKDRYGEFDKAIFSENGRRTIQRILSSHSFYKSKRARLDCVMLEACSGDQDYEDTISPSKDFELYFAKALALFRVHACSGPFGRQSKAVKEFVFLRYFDVVPLSDNIDRALGCVKLRWALQPPCDSLEQKEQTAWYDLQSIATLRGRAMVIRGDHCLEQTISFKGKSHWKDQWFYVNRFAYDSSEPTYYEEDREDSVC